MHSSGRPEEVPGIQSPTRLMRSRINERLEHATRFPVTLIAAPAGFGKSVALRDFLATSGLQAITCDVRREDGTLLAFVRHLSESFSSLAPGALASFPAMQERVLAAEEPVRQLSDWFCEHLKSASGTIAIDDLHYAATDPASIALLADVIERTSERIKWIIAARSDVGLPIATWIAYGRMDIPLSEDDLRFTTEEALAAAETADGVINEQEIESLRQLTEGWPVALTIALRTRTHSRDLRSAASGTREMVFRYLAEQIFGKLTPDQKAFALATSVLFQFDVPAIESYGKSLNWFYEFRRNIAFLNEPSPGVYRYHDLFREFLETELRRNGEQDWKRAVKTAAAYLESRGSDSLALALFTRAAEVAEISRVIRKSGFSLFERGEADVLATALETLPEPAIEHDAVALGLNAMIQAARGRFEIAEPGFVRAIAQAADDKATQCAILQRYAIELIRHERDCIALLEPLAMDGEVPNSARIQLLATLATAYAHADQHERAAEIINRALELADPSLDSAILARLYQQAGYIFHFKGPFEKSKSYAARAVELALQHNLFELAARAYSVLYAVAYENDDIAESLLILERLDECARKAASIQPRIFALVTMYELQAERGDAEALEQLGSRLREYEAAMPRWRAESLLPAQALQAAWNGEFRRAFVLLDGTAPNLGTAERRALRNAEIAVYAYAAGLRDEGDVALQNADSALASSGAITRRSLRSSIILALAELVRGKSTAAHRRLVQVEHDVPPELARIRMLAKAIRDLYQVQNAQKDVSTLASTKDRLRANHLGGMAKLLTVLPFATEQGHGYALLTASERAILQLLAGGASTKDVASQTQRSPHTVDTHIRSICRKLACSGRREAVALALRSGWVES